MQENWSSFASRYGCLYLLVLSYFSFNPFLIGLACSDPHPPNLGGEGGERNRGQRYNNLLERPNFVKRSLQ